MGKKDRNKPNHDELNSVHCKNIERMIGIANQTFRKKIGFVDHDGCASSSLPPTCSSISNVYQETVDEIIRDTIAYWNGRIQKPLRRFKKNDHLALIEIIGDGTQTIQIPDDCPVRVRNYLEVAKSAFDQPLSDQLTMHAILSPHSFCFVDESEVSLVPHLDHDRYRKQTTWMYGRPIINHIGELSIYSNFIFSRRSPLFKFKYQVFHSKENSTDRLDVEALFVEGEYAGVCHYHVATDYSTARLLEKHFKPKVAVELTDVHNKDKLIFKYPEDISQHTLPSSKMQEYLYVIREWKNHPDLAGGPLFQTYVERIKRDSRIIDLSRWAMSA